MEIKSPFSKAGMTVEDACKTKNFFLEKLSDGTVRLKRTHYYYLQDCPLGQLYVASNLGLKGIVLIVYFGEEMPLFKEKINSPLKLTGGRMKFFPNLNIFWSFHCP